MHNILSCGRQYLTASTSYWITLQEKLTSTDLAPINSTLSWSLCPITTHSLKMMSYWEIHNVLAQQKYSCVFVLMNVDINFTRIQVNSDLLKHFRNHDELMLSASPSPDMSTLTTKLPQHIYQQITRFLHPFPRPKTVFTAISGDRDTANRHTSNDNHRRRKSDKSRLLR